MAASVARQKVVLNSFSTCACIQTLIIFWSCLIIQLLSFESIIFSCEYTPHILFAPRNHIPLCYAITRMCKEQKRLERSCEDSVEISLVNKQSVSCFGDEWIIARFPNSYWHRCNMASIKAELPEQGRQFLPSSSVSRVAMAFKVSTLVLIIGFLVCIHYPSICAGKPSRKYTPLGVPYKGK